MQNHWTGWSQKKSDPAIKSDFLDVTLACESGQQLWALQNRNDKGTLEDQVKTLQKHMGAVLATLKCLKTSVDALEKRVPIEEKKEIKEMMEA